MNFRFHLTQYIQDYFNEKSNIFFKKINFFFVLSLPNLMCTLHLTAGISCEYTQFKCSVATCSYWLLLYHLQYRAK